MGVFLVSLAGLPPLAGFALVVIGLLNSVVSLYYYARLVKVMFLDQPRAEDPPVRFRLGDLGAVGLLSLATLYLGVRFGWLLDRADAARRVFAG